MNNIKNNSVCRKKTISIHGELNFDEEMISMIKYVDANGKPYYFKILDGIPDSESQSSDEGREPITAEDVSVQLSDIKSLFTILTNDQRNIVMHIYYMYMNNIKIVNRSESGDNDVSNPKIIIQGPAGSGKSTIIHFIEKLITWEENKVSDTPQKIKVLKCAFTGKAASNIDGFTLHHIFSIRPVYKTRSLTKKRLNEKVDFFQSCLFFICDEISMVGEKLMTSVDMRLQQIFDKKKLYGDRFVLLVGDLFQIDPVMQTPFYPNSKFWTCCDFYELSKIIRQQDERFITALNNFRDSRMTKDDIQLLQSREIKDVTVVPDKAIHLFYTNKYVDQFNDEKIKTSNGQVEKVNLVDDSEKWSPENLPVKIGIRYMITNNLDVGDGLANGTTGIVKGFDYDKNNVVDAIWMEFHSKDIGKKTRLNYLKKHSQLGFENCVPIQRSKIVVKLKTAPKVSRVFANMFPLKAAEALTVHKSQGQTYHDGVCVHITNDPHDKLRTDKTLLYVALTRVTRLEDLYILGNLNTSITSAKFERTQTMLNQLRTEKKVKLAFETFEDKKGDVIIYLNTGLTFDEHHEFVTSDEWYGNASLLIFTETNTIESDDIEVPGFEIAFRSDDGIAERTGGGIICYKKPNVPVEIVATYSDDEDKIFLTLLLFQNYLYVITGTKGDQGVQFEEAVSELIKEFVGENKCIGFIGDFHMDSTVLESASNYISMNEIKFKKEIMIPEDAPQSDLILTSNFEIPMGQIGFYQYIPSSHKPMYVKLPEHKNYKKKSTKSTYLV